ncbi:hypothetical protein ACFOYU_04405 [Microvirga sp. GCM10011540]|uniref:hypothetical protein n=1 Tax=Microvirga sp. GCM10011540 TaxID=3317338 RepID=UPI00360E4AA2
MRYRVGDQERRARAREALLTPKGRDADHSIATHGHPSIRKLGTDPISFYLHLAPQIL